MKFQSYTLSKKKKKKNFNNLIRRGTLGYNFYMGMQNGSKVEVWQRGLLIHASEWHFEVFQCLYREAIHLQCFLPTRYVNGHGHTREPDDLYPIWCTTGNLVALVWLYPQRCNSQLCSATYWKVCFSVCNTAKLGIGSGNKSESSCTVVGQFFA